MGQLVLIRRRPLHPSSQFRRQTYGNVVHVGLGTQIGIILAQYVVFPIHQVTGI